MKNDWFYIAHILFWMTLLIDRAISSENASKYFRLVEVFLLGGMAMHVILV